MCRGVDSPCELLRAVPVVLRKSNKGVRAAYASEDEATGTNQIDVKDDDSVNPVLEMSCKVVSM